MEITITIPTLQIIDSAAKELLDKCRGHYCFVLEGQLGAGKTTLIKALCLQLGSRDEVTSPTYALVNEYSINENLITGKDRIYHLDLYRLKSIEEAADIGLEDYLNDTRAWVFIEWPAIAGNLLPDKIVRIFMYTNGDNSRTLRILMP